MPAHPRAARLLQRQSRYLGPSEVPDSLLQILMHDLNEFFGGESLPRVARDLGIHHVFANVVLNDLGDEAVQRTATGGRLLEDRCAFIVRVHRAFHGLDLATYAL